MVEEIASENGHCLCCKLVPAESSVAVKLTVDLAESSGSLMLGL